MELLIDPASDHSAGFMIKCCEIRGGLKIGSRSLSNGRSCLRGSFKPWSGHV